MGNDVSVPKLLTAAQAAEALAISLRSLWARTRRDDIPCVRIGRSVRYDPIDVRRFIAQTKRRKRRDCG